MNNPEATVVRKPLKRRKKRLRKILIALSFLLLGAVCIGLIYFKVQGFKKTLIDLVDKQSNGTYALTIGNTKIDYLELDFALSGVDIAKVDKSDSTGLLGIRIPEIEVNLGSFFDLLGSGQLRIELFRIIEPLARVSAQQPDEPTDKKEPVNIAHEIVSFYPGIRAILDNFDIEDFRIDRADLQLNKSDLIIEVQLLDLLIANWNMRDLSDDAQFKIMLGKQGIDFETSSFSFDAITWSYDDHKLEIDNYSFTQKDSLDRTVLILDGASVVIQDMDYEKLLDEEYIFDLLQINQPVVTANIFPHEADPSKIKSRQPVSDLLKKNLRELLIRNGEINKAEVHLNIMRPNDTVRLLLPEMTLKTSNFVVTEDSSTLMIEKLRLSLSATELDMGNGLAVKFSEMVYDKTYNVDIKDIVLTDTDINAELLRSESLALYNFNIFNFIYTNDLSADSVLMKGGNLTLFEATGDIVHTSGSRPPKPARERSTVHLGKVVLDSINIIYDYLETNAQIQNLNAVTENLVIEDGTTYDLRYFKSPSVTFTSGKNDIRASLTGVFFEPKRFEISSVQGSFKDINLTLKGFTATPENFNPNKPFYHVWNTLHISEIDISGSLPQPDTTQKNTADKPVQEFFFESIMLDRITANLELSQNSQLSFISDNLKVKEVLVAGKASTFGEIQAQMHQLKHSSDKINISVDDVNIATKEQSEISGVSLSLASGDNLQLQKISLNEIIKSDSVWHIEMASVNQVSFIQSENTLNSTLDSISLENITWSPSALPHVGEIGVYKPFMQIKKKPVDSTSVKKSDASQTKQTKKAIAPLSLFDVLKISPGTVAINDQLIAFGDISIRTADNKVAIDMGDLRFDTPSSTFNIGEIKNTGEQLHIYDVRIDAKPEFVEKMEIENDVISGNFDHLVFNGVVWDSLLRKNQFISEQLQIEGFNVRLRRDKTLPDPEAVNKPYLLRELLPLSEKFQLLGIKATDGVLTYREVGEKTGQEGYIVLNDIDFKMNLRKPKTESENVLTGTAKLYDSGLMAFNYSRIDSNHFDLEVRLTDMVLDSLNHMIDPLEAVRLKSGYLKEYDLSVTANDSIATGQALMTYEDLHIEIFKKHSPDVKNFGSSLLTALADGIILKHSKTDAIGTFEQERITFKGPINYWVKCAIHGAMAAVRKGKSASNVSD
ncbi:hypothetical protein [Fulvivirga sedimenti]|uniref:DUF748 domain-containing protein n=1 Tax=Fulvivirga sedimenti TaxID=2879465 RepID=A0A9X1HVD9_9BACT|nr:hypothetical protein [Fulvivirga sedimenti]MCA6075433.1 hypothetical protein [Fulvivirga sedimenti]MCA6076610.1 hypothetical protein [Fulvivirga sedimenti]MCA6077738.1 hypothetical protein [Fulvivirga sedimenti]